MRRSIALLLIIAAILASASCQAKHKEAVDVSAVTSYKDIPGIEESEIAAIEDLKNIRDKFIYGQMHETEAFIQPDGTYSGFAVKFCAFLTELFGIEFSLQLFDWETLKNGIDNQLIDFTGDLTPTPERMRQYHMTHPIAERSLRIFTISEGVEIQNERDIEGLKVGSLAGTIDIDHVLQYYPNLEFRVVEVESFDEAAAKLQSREIDAFVTEGVIDPLFEQYGNIISKEFFPLVYTSVSLTTANDELRPIIDVVNKYISAGGIDVLYDFHTEGNNEYARYKLARSFTIEERAYMDFMAVSRSPVMLALEPDNYPICFYNKEEKEFQGIAVDVLEEISNLTGLVFEIANDENTPWSETLAMLESGRASMVSQLLHTTEREGSFLWSASYASAYYALISRSDYPNLASYQVVRARVGTTRRSAFEDKYNEWFADNTNLILYDDQIEVLDALESGDIDLLMGSNYLMLMQQNYREKPGYKINVRFSAPMESHFGFNINEAVLCSIINKAQYYVNTSVISDDWTSRGYDYAKQIAQQRLVIFVAIAAVLAIILFLTVFSLRRKGKQNLVLDKIVQDRTVELEEALVNAEAANQAKSAFLSTMSHEIRTPMNAILGITEIQLQNDSLDKTVKEALGKIYTSGDLLLGIINDILDLSKIEAGKLELTVAKYEIASLVSDTAQLNMMRIGSKPIEFELFVDELLPTLLMGDELRVKQILNNLLSNAFKYTAEGTVKLSVTCETTVTQTDEITLVFTVSDTGQGMTEEQVNKLFDEYSRFNLEANRKTEGTGLGMSITRKLILLMNGEIHIDSEPGKGSIFTVKLPQSIVGSEVLGKEMAENLHQFRTSSRSKMKRVQITRELMPYGSVLIVDDVETNIYVARGLMTPYSLRIDSAESGFAAIEKIKNGNIYDIVFMDHMMPQMDGIEATQKIRGLGYTHPIVALTANAVAGQADIFLGNGFDDFISKPIDVRQLNTVLNKLIRDKQTPETLEAARKLAEESLAGRAQTQTETGAGAEDPGSAGGGGDSGVPVLDPHFAEIFVRDANKAITTLEGIKNSGDYRDEDNLRAYIINVHGMKSALANIKAMELSAVALKLEAAGREKRFEMIESETPVFLTSLRDFVGRLIPEQGSEPGDGETTEDDTAFLKEKLLAIVEACEQYDEASAEEALSELNERSWTKPTKKLLQTIAEHLLHSDFEEAAQEAGRYLV